jgi:hypothetical protein
MASGGLIAKECLCWRANDWRKRLLINPFHLSRSSHTVKSVLPERGMQCVTVIILSRLRSLRESARTKGGRAQQVLFSPTPPCAVWIFLLCCLLVRLAITLKSQTEEKSDGEIPLFLSSAPCRNVFWWPADSLDAARGLSYPALCDIVR